MDISDPSHENKNGENGPHGEWIATLVREWASMLPDQAPLSFFVSQNTVQSLQHLDFHKACAEVTRVLGAKPYLSFPEYQSQFNSGAIGRQDVDEGMRRSGFDFLQVDSSSSLMAHSRALLFAETPRISPASRDWYVATHLAEIPDAKHLWSEIKRLSWPTELDPFEEDNSTPLIGLFRQDFGGLPSHDVRRALGGLSGMFLDRGGASKSMPGRGEGFASFAFGLLSQTPQIEPWLAAAANEAKLLRDGRCSSSDIVRELIQWQQPEEMYQSNIVRRTIFAHPGWASMFWRLERYPEERASTELPVRLMDYLAVQLILEKHRCLDAIPGTFGHARSWEKPGELRRFIGDRCPPLPVVVPDGAWDLFWALRHQGYHAARFAAMDPHAKSQLVELVTKFGRRQRLAVWQEAQEAAYRNQILGAFALRSKATKPRDHTPDFQVMTCLDDREESFRRAIEETSPGAETFGGPGFFGLPIKFQALGQVDANSSCPLHVPATHKVREVPLGASHRTRMLRQQTISRVMHRIESSGREDVSGSLLLGVFGLLAYPAMVLGLIFPVMAARFRAFVTKLSGPPVRTEFEFIEPEPGATPQECIGKGTFGLQDQIARVGGLLENIGFTSHFAKVVVFLGHGSTSVNNPYKSAYDCGACAGNDGGSNAKLFAYLGNLPEVRAGLALKGIVIPKDTVFVGGIHDTCNDDVILFEPQGFPPQVATRIHEVHKSLRRAARVNARERCRRFHSASRFITEDEAIRHVQGRAQDLSQPRPEFGHCTNAMAVYAPRSLTRGLFLDRRSFLISYEPETDPEGTIIERLFAGILPVLAGINLQYYFSRVDNDKLGAGTKLPHNPTAMVGVMEGASGDLRTGLPRQAVEIHNPMRLLVVIYSTPDLLAEVVKRQAYIRGMVDNAWIRLVCLDWKTGDQFIWVPHLGFENVRSNGGHAPVINGFKQSSDWFLGRMQNLNPVLIGDHESQSQKQSDSPPIGSGKGVG